MTKWLMIAIAGSALALGCGNDKSDPDPGGSDAPGERARNCPTARSADAIPQRLGATAAVAQMTFADLRDQLHVQCGGCHESPASNGGFSYPFTYTAIASVADRMASQLAGQKMPPDNIRNADPDYYLQLGSRMQAWIRAGKPETDAFQLPDETVANGQQLAPAIAAAMTDLGDCVPVADVIGKDAARDAMFAAATALPEQLDQTDLVSLDAYELAKHGTVAYDVEYPLWADNAHKGRWVHVPTAADGVTRQPIAYDPATGNFQIPDNTRFYKTFFKQVTEDDGAVRYRKVETRLIVVRHAPAEPLYGTYLWNANESAAALHTIAYRDETPFKDWVMHLETDTRTHATRTYAVPGRVRCVQCHQGSESDSFILGFTPLQIHRRAMGDGGRQTPTQDDEMSQLSRLASYGVITGVAPDTAPRLETSGGATVPRNDHELRFQGYATGNCAHCHNPKGYAIAQGINLRLQPPSVFHFAIGVTAQRGTKLLLSPQSPADSAIWEHMALDTHTLGTTPMLHMPMNTPGIDCNGLNLLGKWMKSVPLSPSPTDTDITNALDAAASYSADCPAQDDIKWLDEDYSDSPDYAPRRQDWNTAVGIPQSIRALQLSDEEMTLARTSLPVSWWPGNQCVYPSKTAQDVPGGPRPWMVDSDNEPIHDYGQVRYQTPGEYFFTTVCFNCHGVHADANTALAVSIFALTDATTRVANLHAGLFGHRADGTPNNSIFDLRDDSGATRNYAMNYLIWMASGGTQAKFPPVLSEIIGPNGGNMLYQIRNNLCDGLLPGSTHETSKDAQAYEVRYTGCTLGGKYPVTDDLGYGADHLPLDAAAQTAWLDRAAQNAGMLIFRFLQENIAIDKFPATTCTDLFPAK